HLMMYYNYKIVMFPQVTSGILPTFEHLSFSINKKKKMINWINYIEDKTEQSITNLGIPEDWASYCRLLLFLLFLVIIASFAFFITKRIITQFLYKVFRKTSFTWDDSF